MTFKNFSLSGEEILSPLAREAPFRCDRLMWALEAFVGEGTTLGTHVAGLKAATSVYLVPPRAILRAVPDAAALVVVDLPTRTVELIHIFPEYGAGDDETWPNVVTLAEAALT